MRDIVNENVTLIGGRRNNQNYHRQVLIEYQRMNQVATEYERKHVYRIECNDCNFVLTDRGMNVSLWFLFLYSILTSILGCTTLGSCRPIIFNRFIT